MKGRPEKPSETELGQRLRDVRAALGDPIREEFCVGLGISRDGLAGYERGKSKPTADVLARYRELHGVDINWLTTGEGEMFSERADKLPSTGLPIPSDFAFIPRYDIQAGAGSGIAVNGEEQVGQFAVDRRWFRDIGLDPSQCKVIVADGQSMEPTIADGAPLIVDTTIDRLIDGHIYVINLHGDLVVKRVQRILDGSFELLSDNPRYRPLKITQADHDSIHIIGRVRFALQPY